MNPLFDITNLQIRSNKLLYLNELILFLEKKSFKRINNLK